MSRGAHRDRKHTQTVLGRDNICLSGLPEPNFLTFSYIICLNFGS